MSKGAVQCGVSQSAASQHVQEVERRLGLPLLDRSTRPLELTPAGQLYLDLCRDIVRRDDEFLHQLEALKRDVSGTLRVASIYSIGITEMSHLQDEFGARYPNTTLQVDYMRPDKIYEAVLSDRADLGLVSYPEPNREIAVVPWRQEEMQVALAPSHPLAKLTVLEPARPQRPGLRGLRRGPSPSAVSSTVSCARRASKSRSSCTSTTYR